MQVNVLSALKRSGGRDRRLALAATAAGLVLVATGCGSGSTASPPPSGAVSTTTTGPASSQPPGGNQMPGHQVPGHQVTVQMTDFHLALSDSTLAPGTYTFVAVNAGQDVHAIEIDGPGVSDQRTPGVVQPGHSASLTVTLQPGSYDMYCPVDGHRAMGMETHFTVGAAGTGSSSPGGSNTGGY